MNDTRRKILGGTAAALALGTLPMARAQRAPDLVVYKNASCGCCGEWEKHMQAAGFRVDTRALSDVAPIKRKLGVPETLYSCHTAVVDDYVVEGHVPAADVWRLLRERPQAKGLAVPGMPIGSPGMEQGPPQRYATMAFDERRTWVFERH